MTDRHELGAFLRSRRERLRPPDVGMPLTARRRTPGLRREEVAALAGMSVDYLARLEQGRGPQPSPGVAAALARALRLSDDERDHLYRLAGQPPPAPATASLHVRPGMLRILDRLRDDAAMVIADTGDVLAWTPLDAVLFADFASLADGERNLYRLTFLPGRLRRTGTSADADHERNARAHVAELRATLGRRPGDARLRALIDELYAGSELFARLWDLGDVAVRRATRKRIVHPEVGELELDCEVLLSPEGDQRLVLHTAPPGSETARRLDLLRVIGTQQLAPDRSPR